MKAFIVGVNKKMIDDYLEAPRHGLIISAPTGFGKSQVLNYIAAHLLDDDAEQLQQSSSYSLIESEKSIGIDEIRQIKSFLKLKQSENGKGRVIIVKDCNKMTIEAQNSFLKVLEEPPVDTYFLMSAKNTSKLLPTIKSRVQIIELKPYSRNVLSTYFAQQGYDPTKINRAYSMSGGLFGEMTSILDGSSDGSSFEQAKMIISSNHYQRLLLVDSLSKDKDQAGSLLYALRRTLMVALHSDKNSSEQTRKLHKALVAVSESERLVANGSPNLKLLLSNLMLSL